MLTLEKTTWERIYLKLSVRATEGELSKDNVRFYLLNASDGISTEFKILEKSAVSALLQLNITNLGTNRCVGNGSYRVIAAQGDFVIGPLLCELESEVLASWNNHFLYNGSKGCYTVTFMVDEFTLQPELKILFYDMKTSKGKKPKRFIKRIWQKTKDSLKQLRKKIRKLYYQLIRNTSKGNTILFLSEMGDQLPLNMESVYSRLVQRGLDKEYKIIFFLKRKPENGYSISEKIKLTKMVCHADIIIVDDYVSFFDNFSLDSDVKLIQIWHAGAGFKGVGYSRWGHYGCPGPVCPHRRYDYCIAGSKSITHFFSEQFGILDEQIIPTGMPRMDQFIDPDHRKEITEKLYINYPALKGREVILFAPTYRGQGRKTAYYPYNKVDFQELYQYCCDNDAVMLFKMHPWVSEAVPFSAEFSDRFIDLNSYPNINDLFYITDLLITDYSSSMYEYILMRKPMLLYAFDKNQFATSRGFHRDYDSNVPGKICETFDELISALQKKDFEYEKVEQFISYYYDQVDSNSSDRVIDWLILGNLPEKYSIPLEKKKAEIEMIRSKKIYRPDPASWDGVMLVSKNPA